MKASRQRKNAPRPTVVQFPPTRANVPQSLRRLADKVEAGRYGDVRICAVVIVQGASKIALFGYGNGTDMEVSGALARGAALSGACLDDIDEPPEPEQAS